MVKAVEILSSWARFFNPTQEQLEIARHRAIMYDTCGAKQELDEEVLIEYVA